MNPCNSPAVQVFDIADGNRDFSRIYNGMHGVLGSGYLPGEQPGQGTHDATQHLDAEGDASS